MFMYDYMNRNLSLAFSNTWIQNAEINEHYNLRNACDLFIPRTRYVYLDRHPIVHFGKQWNLLEQNVRESENKYIFSKKVKELLIERMLLYDNVN